ncbi:MAG TPA: glycolate oxidase subunit GlcF [Steroidobacteraceae bacterium]
MQTKLIPEFSATPMGEEAAGILRKCVHCGFCNATCPTYQLLGDELDGPRGRIYLIKQVLEGSEVTRTTQIHLDRCLTCLNCETTCPSGVKYGHLVEIGRQIVETRVARPALEKLARWSLKEGLTSRLFGPALRLGRLLRPILPKVLRAKVSEQASRRAPLPTPVTRARKMLMLEGCVQPAMMPNIDDAMLRVLDRAGVQVVRAAGTACCGALRMHLSDREGARAHMRRNIDAWTPLLEAGDVEAIISSASACALSLKDYGHALADDPTYAAKAARVSAMVRDLSELLPQLVPALKGQLQGGGAKRVVFHAPCTLQHGQQLRGGVERGLADLGADITSASEESHLCCGSAGTYSVLQPQLAMQLRDRKLANLAKLEPQCILSANIGCIQHLQSGTSTRVMHWIEWLDEALK